jgi:hypothetical protein
VARLRPRGARAHLVVAGAALGRTAIVRLVTGLARVIVRVVVLLLLLTYFVPEVTRGKLAAVRAAVVRGVKGVARVVAGAVATAFGV